MLERAVQLARQNPVKLITADAVQALPEILADAPDDTVPCVFRTFTPLPAQARDRLLSLFSDYGAKRDLLVLSTRGYVGFSSELWLITFINGVKTEKGLAYCQNHGEWLEWLANV